MCCDNMDFSDISSGMIMAIITIVIGLLFYPMIAGQVTRLSEDHYEANGEIFSSLDDCEEANYTQTECEPEEDAVLEDGASRLLAGQLDVFYLLGLIFVSISWALKSIDYL